MPYKLHIGTIDAGGHVDPRPVVATYAPNGTLLEWHLLEGHEPHSTVFDNSLLNISGSNR